MAQKKKHIHPNHVQNLLFGDFDVIKALKELDQITETLGMTQRGFHSFRHTFATNMLIALGLNMNLVMKMTAHSSVKVFDRYNHLAGLISAQTQKKSNSMF